MPTQASKPDRFASARSSCGQWYHPCQSGHIPSTNVEVLNDSPIVTYGKQDNTLCDCCCAYPSSCHMSCYARPCCAMLCHAWPRCAEPCFVMLCRATLYCAVPCHALRRCAVPCFAKASEFFDKQTRAAQELGTCLGPYRVNSGKHAGHPAAAPHQLSVQGPVLHSALRPLQHHIGTVQPPMSSLHAEVQKSHWWWHTTP